MASLLIALPGCAVAGSPSSAPNDELVAEAAVVVVDGETVSSSSSSKIIADVPADLPDRSRASPTWNRRALRADVDADGFCQPGVVADEGRITSMHQVVDGEVQEHTCFSATDDPADSKLGLAWGMLAAIAPSEMLGDVDLFVGYERCIGCDALAFTQVLDEASTVVALAVDVSAFEVSAFEVWADEVSADETSADETSADETSADKTARERLQVTMIHELAHVVSQRPGTQTNPWTSESRCHTHHIGSGCLAGDSYLWAWIQEFWSPELRAGLPADGSVSSRDVAAERCALDPVYVGTYAASRPDEDFAETFAAYVLDVDVGPALDAKLAFFDRYPEFVALRENARAAGFAGSTAAFDRCSLLPLGSDPGGNRPRR